MTNRMSIKMCFFRTVFVDIISVYECYNGTYKMKFYMFISFLPSEFSLNFCPLELIS